MKKLINEVARMQKLAGLLKENEEKQFIGRLKQTAEATNAPDEVVKVAQAIVDEGCCDDRDSIKMTATMENGSVVGVTGETKGAKGNFKFEYKFENGEIKSGYVAPKDEVNEDSGLQNEAYMEDMGPDLEEAMHLISKAWNHIKNNPDIDIAGGDLGAQKDAILSHVESLLDY